MSKKKNLYFAFRMRELIIVSFFLCLILVQISCSKKESGSSSVSGRPVHASAVIKSDVPIYIDAIGMLSSKLSVDIKSQATGKIIKANFDEGSFVKKGDVLFEIDPRPFQAVLNQSIAQLKQNESDRDIAEWIVTKNKGLAAVGAMAAQDYAKILAAYAKTLGMVEADKATIWQNQINLEFCKILSPIDGVTGKRLVDPGNVIVADSGPTLVNIKSVDPLNVDFTIPERNYSILRESMNKGVLKVIVATESLGEGNNVIVRQYSGTLQFLNNTVDPATGTIYLRASVPNSNKEIWPGQFVKVRLIFYIKKDSMMVPRIAVNMGLKGDYVFAIKDNKAKLCWVKKGLDEGDYCIIDSITGDNRFQPGDSVVTIGQMGLVPDCPVEIVETDSFSLDSNSDTSQAADTSRL